MATENGEAPPVEVDENLYDEEDAEDEFVVEQIQGKRKNPKTGKVEYYIKWENYPVEQNTWEPEEHLKCPEIVSKFNEQEKNKRRRKKAQRLSVNWNSQAEGQQTKRARLERGGDSVPGTSQQADIDDDEEEEEEEQLFVERDDYLEENQVEGRKSRDPAAEQVRLRGFERGLSVESIFTPIFGDNNKLYFIIKWQGSPELEMVEAEEIEKNASKLLCKWYRERIYWSLSNPLAADRQTSRKNSTESLS